MDRLAEFSGWLYSYTHVGADSISRGAWGRRETDLKQFL